MTQELTGSDLIIVAQEMALASRKYAESANRLSSLEVVPGQFANAISGQRQMSHLCNVIARKAGWTIEREADLIIDEQDAAVAARK